LHTTTARLAVALVALASLAAGCSSDDDGDDAAPSGTSTTTVADGGATGTAVRQLDFEFAPDRLEGEPGTTLTVAVENAGGASHTFTIDGIVDEELAPGESVTAEVAVPADLDPSGLEFFCRFHRAGGMTGVIVEAS
jgi:plastocyanin